MPIIVRQNDNQSHVHYMNPISNVFYRIFTLINCNPFFPIVFQLGSGSWIAFGQNRTIVEKAQALCYLQEPKREVPIIKDVFDGLTTEKQLEAALEGLQPRVTLQPITPLIELNYITVLKNLQLKQKQVSKKVVETKVSDLLGTD